MKIHTLKHNGKVISQHLKKNYEELKSQTRKACRKAFDKWWKDKAEEADQLSEEFIKQGRGGSILKILKLNTKSKVKDATIINSKDGTKSLNISDKLNRWKEHFSQILNNKSTINPFVLNQLPLPVLKKDEETLTELSNLLYKLELSVALKQCKLVKAAGIDKLNSTIKKIGNEVTVDWIKVLAEKIWETESIPRDWKTQVIVPLHKSGQKSLCNNYRGISLLCVVSKVFTKALSNRIKKLLDCQLGESQCGF